jgi:hypothetical protein
MNQRFQGKQANTEQGQNNQTLDMCMGELKKLGLCPMLNKEVLCTPYNKEKN